VLEISGLSGSTPAQERASGFRNGIKANANVKLATSVTSEWQKSKAVPAAAAALQGNKNVQVVHAHNDDSTEGSYIAAKNVNVNMDVSKMLFFGTDEITATDAKAMCEKYGCEAK
jgi:ribose transport system substrate-binding protein